ncbi:hypothetical protein AC579_1594 [Pseudocercospora musae]|uniref:Cytochrome P450 n=1 Tax=Pseudocercospora musae TaxID=113226 RepID=A0A139HML3_9PEZI|nr:hypothetical protein AC579_1594 [Pseudocercospora musae]
MLTNSPFLPAALLVAGLVLSFPKLRSFIRKLRIYLKYCKSHRAFSVEAGQGKHQWLEDPFSQSRNFWLCRYPAIKHVFSRAAIQETDHRAGFDWFHYAGWEIPTFDPRYKHTVRDADQTVHGKLAKSKLNTLLDTVQDIGYSEIDRIKSAVGPDGRTVSLHSLMYRLGYNVNCIGIFGPDLDHVVTRWVLQDFTERQHVMFNCFNWPLPVWLSTRVIPACRQTAAARQALYDLLLSWYQSGGLKNASEEMKAIVDVFERAKSPPDIGTKFLNMMMIAFLANTPETLGWLMIYIIQAPELYKVIKAECDALGESLVTVNFKSATPHLYSAFFETFRMYVFTGTPATVTKPCTLPGMGDHVFQPGDILHSFAEACAMDVEIYGSDVEYWKGHRFIGEGEALLKYDLTFGLGRSPCPGRNFAIVELCMLAARMIKTFEFSDAFISEKLSFKDPDFEVHRPVEAGKAKIIDLDGKVTEVLHPGNKSDQGLPGMTASNIPVNDFACKLTPR